MAWDRRLLSRSQHLTLLISGLRGIYPLISSDGTLSDAAQRAGIQVKFKVGLCGRYKPTKEHAQEASRNFGLIVQDAEDELRLQAEKLAAQIPAVDEWDDQTFDEIPPVVVEEEEEDEGRFERFSLSSSLETLMDQAFFKLVQYRRKFKLGWAGAEALYAEVEKNQRKPEDVLKDKQRVRAAMVFAFLILTFLLFQTDYRTYRLQIRKSTNCRQPISCPMILYVAWARLRRSICP